MSGFTVNYNNSIEGVAFNDLYLDSNGNLAFVDTGATEIEETCYHAVQLCIGDYSYNTTLGIPYDQYLSSNAPIGKRLKRSIIQALLGVNGVQSIDSFSLALNTITRVLQLNVTVNIIPGLIPGNQININI